MSKPSSKNTAVFAALADPTRLAIVERLRGGEQCVGDLCSGTGGRQSLISFHLKVLRDAGIVDAEKRGRTVTYRLSPHAIRELASFVHGLQRPDRSPPNALLADLETCRQYIDHF